MNKHKSKSCDSMKQVTSSWALLARVMLAVVAVLPAPQALTAETIEAILPGQNYAPVGLGCAVLLNPSSGDVLVGSYRVAAAPAEATIHRLIPTGPSFSATGVDGGL